MLGYSLFVPNQIQLKERGLDAALNIPFIFTTEMHYHDLANEFLIDRVTGTWHPQILVTRAGQNPLTDVSAKNYAQYVMNFSEWSDRSGVDWTTCSYQTDVFGKYQEQLRNGKWSRAGEPLSESTTNSYVDAACEVLRWMAYKGYREEFILPTVTRTIVSTAMSKQAARPQRSSSRAWGS